MKRKDKGMLDIIYAFICGILGGAVGGFVCGVICYYFGR